MRQLILTVVFLAGCGATVDPVYTRCVEERKSYCKRLFACVKIGGLVGVTVNFENEDNCTTERSKECSTVSSSNACPGGSSSSYDSGKHDQCIKDQADQSCDSFANRPNSCSTYCCTTDGGSC